MLEIAGRKVLNYLRVSPKLLVVGLEGDRHTEIRGDKEWCDRREREISKALSGDNRYSEPILAMNTAAAPSEIPTDEFMDLPQYSFGDSNSQPVTNAAGDDNCLPLPSYDFSKCR